MDATVISAFTAMTSTDPARPVLTFYDDATGERTELSGATLGNWIAKTANLLRDGLGLGPGDVAAVRLPPHWQSAGVLLGCWSAGLAVALDAGTRDHAVGFVTADGVAAAGADEVYALALAPLGLPFRSGPPSGALDYAVEVRAFGDHFSGSVSPQWAALADGTTHAELARRGTGRAAPLAGRVFVDGDAVADPLDWLVAPLVAGSSIVLGRHVDPTTVDARLATERAVRFP